jgi:hypothetical protein
MAELEMPSTPVGDWTIHYLSDIDILNIRFGRSGPAYNVDLLGGLMLRVDFDTGEVIGAEIENFESDFLEPYSDLAPIWARIKKSLAG